MSRKGLIIICAVLMLVFFTLLTLLTLLTSCQMYTTREQAADEAVAKPPKDFKSISSDNSTPYIGPFSIMIQDFAVSDITIPLGVSQELHFGNEPIPDDTEVVWTSGDIIELTPSDDVGYSVIITGISTGRTVLTVKVGSNAATCIVRVS